MEDLVLVFGTLTVCLLVTVSLVAFAVASRARTLQ